MIKEIIKYPNKILRQKSKEIKEINDEIKNLAQDMLDTHKQARGVGLAAPQIGILKRIIIVQFPDGPKVFLNPEIIKKSREAEVGEEGCLCFPGIYLRIKRSRKIEMKALDIDGKEIQLSAEGLRARIFQHEIDHLQGILILDKIPLLQKIKLKLKLKINVSN